MQLINKLSELRKRIAELKTLENERKQTEEALRQSEEKYRTILEEMEEGYFETDLVGNLTFINDAGCRHLGYSRQELIGMNNRVYADEKNAKKVFQAFNKVYKTGEPCTVFNYEITRKDGAKAIIEMSVSLMRNSEGELIGFRGISRHVTEQKKMEEALRQSEEKYRNILENMQEVYYEIDLAGNWTFLNEAFYEHLGYRKEELIGKKSRQYQDETTARELYQAYTRLYRTGEPIRAIEAKWICKDGAKKTYEMSASLMRNSEGEPIGFRGVSRDITERKQAEDALWESEERYRTAIEQSNDGIALVKGDLHIFVNQKMVEIFGYDRPEEIIGQPVAILVHPDDRERIRNLNRQRQKEELVQDKYEVKGQRKNGDPIYIEISEAKTTYQGEAISLVYLRDITDRKRAAEALRTLSIKDDLTGLYNRRGFFALAEQGLKTAQRMGTEMLLIYGDLDNLKEINDTFGHKEGDKALTIISGILKETFRESDILARIGGDEFVMLAINTLENSAEKLINRFEQVLNDHHLQTKPPYKLAMSFGIACFNPQNPCAIDVLIAQGDKLMYENKQKKRRPV